MFPADFPYINDVNKASLQATPDKFFLPLGTNIKEAIAAMPLNPEFKKKDLSNVIAEVFNRYRTEGTSDIMDNIKVKVLSDVEPRTKDVAREMYEIIAEGEQA